MTREELALWLRVNVRRRRLQRIGEFDSADLEPAIELPPQDRQNWLDMADAVLELTGNDEPIERLSELGRDWIRYTMQIRDPAWRDEMRYAVVIEMRAVVDKLDRECTVPPRRST